MTRIRIKICGLTRAEDITLVSKLGVVMAGFIFAPKSPRCLTVSQAEKLSRELPKKIKRVGVFVDADPETVRVTTERAALDLLQFHGAEQPEYCRQFGIPFFKAFRVRGHLDSGQLLSYGAEAILLDAYSPDAQGGTGKTFDWGLAREAVAEGVRVILAGGLQPGNIQEAIRQVRPWGVDVSSGVEASPGIKDPKKLRSLIRALRG